MSITVDITPEVEAAAKASFSPGKMGMCVLEMAFHLQHPEVGRVISGYKTVHDVRGIGDLFFIPKDLSSLVVKAFDYGLPIKYGTYTLEAVS